MACRFAANGKVPASPALRDTGAVTRDLVLLGSTGSIGTQALDVVRRNPDRFRIVGLGAGGARVDLLCEQAMKQRAEVVAIANPSAASAVETSLRSAGVTTKVLTGPDA